MVGSWPKTLCSLSALSRNGALPSAHRGDRPRAAADGKRGEVSVLSLTVAPFDRSRTHGGIAAPPVKVFCPSISYSSAPPPGARANLSSSQDRPQARHNLGSRPWPWSQYTDSVLRSPIGAGRRTGSSSYGPGMVPKERQPPGPPMTLANMRELGVIRLIASCLNDACRHSALIEV